MATTSRFISNRPNPPRITLFEPRDSTSHVWEKYQKEKLRMVHTYHGEIWDFAFNTDAIVVPVNSAGIMLEEYRVYFNDPLLEQRLRSEIRKRHAGKLLMGRAVIVETRNQLFPYIICTPIVRPDFVRGSEPTNAYVAMRAILELWRFGKYHRKCVRNFIETIGVSMLVADQGGCLVDAVAKEQLRAIEEIYSQWLSIPRRPTHLTLVPDSRKS